MVGYIQRIGRHRLARNSVLLALVQLVNLVIPLVVMLRLTSVLGLETYGVVAFAAALVMISAVIIDFGFSLSAVHKVALLRSNPTEVEKYAGAVYTIKFLALVAISVCFVVYGCATQKYAGYAPIFWTSILPLLGLALQPNWLFMGLERMALVAQVTIISRCIFGCLAFLLVGGPEDYYRVPLVDGIGQIIAGLYGLSFWYIGGGRIQRARIPQIKTALRETIGFLLSRVCVITYQNTGVLVLGFVGSTASAGIFSIADQFYRGIQCLYAPIGQAVYPYMVMERNFKMYVRLLSTLLLSAILLAFVVIQTSPFVISNFLGSEWSGVAPTLAVFMVGAVVTTLNVFSGYPLAAA